MSISHWGIFAGCWAQPWRDRALIWTPCDFDYWCRYMYGSEECT